MRYKHYVVVILLMLLGAFPLQGTETFNVDDRFDASLKYIYEKLKTIEMQGLTLGRHISEYTGNNIPDSMRIDMEFLGVSELGKADDAAHKKETYDYRVVKPKDLILLQSPIITVPVVYLRLEVDKEGYIIKMLSAFSSRFKDDVLSHITKLYSDEEMYPFYSSKVKYPFICYNDLGNIKAWTLFTPQMWFRIKVLYTRTALIKQAEINNVDKDNKISLLILPVINNYLNMQLRQGDFNVGFRESPRTGACILSWWAIYPQEVDKSMVAAENFITEPLMPKKNKLSAQ